MQISNIQKALRIVGKAELARKLGLTRAAVYSWGKHDRIPPQYVLKVEELSGVSRHDISPDIFGPKAQK